MAAAQPLKIRMVAGLGNPGEEYAETRHNAGFKAIDELARQAGVTYWKNQAGAEVALININDPEEEGGKRQIVLVKPQSYMNTSGGPISKLCREYKIKADELLVIHDELDIPAGDVRVKVGGGHAGHNGLRSIIDKMGSRDFSRIRTGIGNPPGKMAVADYVLKQLRAREAEDFQDTCARAADAAGLAIVHGVIYARDRQRRRFRQRQALKPTKKGQVYFGGLYLCKRCSRHIAINRAPPYAHSTPKGAGLITTRGRPLCRFTR